MRKTFSTLLIMSFCLFSMYGQKSDTSTIEFGTYFCLIVNGYGQMCLEVPDWNAAYVKFGITDRHRIRARFYQFSKQDDEPSMYYGDHNYRGFKWTCGYEYELPIWWWFSATAGAEYVNIRYEEDGYRGGYEGVERSQVNNRINIHGLNLPIGLHLTIAKYVRVSLEFGTTWRLMQREDLINLNQTNRRDILWLCGDANLSAGIRF